MDNFTLTITLVTSACSLVFGVVAVASSLYGFPAWHPRNLDQIVIDFKQAPQ